MCLYIRSSHPLDANFILCDKNSDGRNTTISVFETKCYGNPTDESVIGWIDPVLKNIENKGYSEFIRYNTTSVHFLLYAAFGANGQIAKDKSIQILEHFIKYIKTKPLHYIPDHGCTNMYSPTGLQNTINFCKEFKNPDNLEHEELIKYCSKICEDNFKIKKGLFTQYLSTASNMQYFMYYCFIGIISGLVIGEFILGVNKWWTTRTTESLGWDYNSTMSRGMAPFFTSATFM